MTPQMDTLGSPYGYDNPTTSGVLGAKNLRKETMIYSSNASNQMLGDAKGVKVEANLPLL